MIGNNGTENPFEVDRIEVRRPVVRLFREYGADNPLLLTVAIVATVLAPLLSLVPAYVLKVIIDSVLQQNAPFRIPLVPTGWIPATRWEQIVLSVVIVVGTAGVQQLTTLVKDWGWQLFSERVQHDLRVNTFDKTQRLGMDFFTNQQTGQIISIINNDVNELDNFLRNYAANISHICFGFLGTAIILFSMNWQLATVTLLPVPVMAGISIKYAGTVRERYAKIRHTLGDLHSRIDTSINGISIVKSFGREDYERERVADASGKYFDARWNMLKVRVRFFPLLNFMNYVGFAVTLLVGGYWITVGPPTLFSGTLSIGTLVAFLTYNRQFNTPLIQLGDLLDKYEDGRASIVRVFALSDYPIDIEKNDDAIPLNSVEGRVNFEDVSFSYPASDDAVLKNVTVDVKPGQTVGIVGPTGSGKTTLIKLLLRFYDPSDGTIRLDGMDLRTLNANSLRESIGYVSQNPVLFDGTIRENIAYANLDADPAAIEAAAQVANAHEFISSLDEGYETPVGERGVKLSGGQRQRIAIARAVLKDPDILVFDEATSQVDNETEFLIQESLENLIRNRTTFIIAHRLSTVLSSDTIIVLEDGELVEAGTHVELVDEDGLYADLWRVQIGQSNQLSEAFRTQAIERSNSELSG